MGRPRKQSISIICRSFEECLPEIERLIETRRFRWQLKSLNWIDYDDVKQILLRHLFLKWHLFNQEKKLSSWVMTVVNNQMINLIRNHYGNFSRPCLKCEFYEGEDGCKKFGIVSNKCDLYRTWTYGKKTKHDIQLPLPMENHTNEVFEIKSENVDVDKTAPHIHIKMKEVLKPLEWIVYYNLFMLNKSEEEVGKMLKFKSREPGRYCGYKQVTAIKKIIISKVRAILYNDEIEIVNN